MNDPLIATTHSTSNPARAPLRIVAAWRATTPGAKDLVTSLCAAHHRLAAESAARERDIRTRIALRARQLRARLRQHYLAGLREAQAQLPDLVREACAELERHLLNDAADVALAVAEKVLGTAFTEDPRILRQKIARELGAIDLSHQVITVAINTRHPLHTVCEPLHGVTICTDPTLPAESAELLSAHGAIRLDWRETLRRVATRIREAAASVTPQYGEPS